MTTTTLEFTKTRRASLVAAIFMMATSAIGPGFITQTATFTAKMGSAFAFGILASILIDFVVQMNIWRIVTLTRMRAAELANKAIPGSGYLLAVLVIFGGLVFNVGNIAGAGLGLNALLGLDPKWGGGLSALLAIGIFSSHRAGLAVDRMVIWLGVMMIGLTVFVAFASNPPLGEALYQTVLPDQISFATITTIVGGTVGGYITYAGAHRLLDRGTTGEENLAVVTKAALSGIFVTGIMRYVLFLAVLGVVASGVIIDTSGQGANPAAQAFQAAAGQFGLRAFGLILWAAAITSVIGAAYTSMSFISVFKPNITEQGRNRATTIFIAVSLLTYLMMGTAPAALLLFAGGFNGLILPIGLSLFIYVGWCRSDMMGGYHYPRWLLVLGALTCLLTWYMAIKSIGPIFAFLNVV
ncbi:NRAMP family divalent metal transporter [Pseudomonas aeruginosa]|uniref:NRAMP family divalent metal transporter n=1 Tax=Pseudomonas TaxID=286 RepID=UPI001F3FD700|nr:MULTISPECIES: NRAMP family divalent metal transporter [Pseudomonas]ELV1376234.1 divalent metal cation transporter [Pseudomonas aeruginosa]MDY1221214.1 NRAMP family divalent metal transporter [Pseudomonas aeruginosa]MDY1536408.1 NRAMP family divalent metal transporter [Pseudomonas aeruginosa]HBN9706725.1 divalent metal cation transporter [Pseudomonas aeruginosa]HBN9725655.1 divalent metal cation transporter [Pseudomonas aeruginosa]